MQSATGSRFLRQGMVTSDMLAQCAAMIMQCQHKARGESWKTAVKHELFEAQVQLRDMAVSSRHLFRPCRHRHGLNSCHCGCRYFCGTSPMLIKADSHTVAAAFASSGSNRMENPKPQIHSALLFSRHSKWWDATVCQSLSSGSCI